MNGHLILTCSNQTDLVQGNLGGYHLSSAENTTLLGLTSSAPVNNTSPSAPHKSVDTLNTVVSSHNRRMWGSDSDDRMCTTLKLEATCALLMGTELSSLCLVNRRIIYYKKKTHKWESSNISLFHILYVLQGTRSESLRESCKFSQV